MKRFTVKCAAGVLSAVMLLGAALSVSAATLDKDNTSGIVPVTANVAPTYTVTIPASVDFGTVAKGMAEQSKAFPVTLSDAVMNQDAAVTVSVTSDFAMKDQDGQGTNQLAYRLFNAATGGEALATGGTYAVFRAGTAAAGETQVVNGGAQANGRVTMDPANIVFAGDYKGTMTFAIAYEE